MPTPMCVPEHISTGEVLNVVVKYIQSQIAKNPAMGIALTARMVHLPSKALFAVRMSKARRRDRLSVMWAMPALFFCAMMPR
jgi:hypothetical protein